QVYLRKEELDALRKAAARSRRSVADLIRDAIRKVVLRPQGEGRSQFGMESRSARPLITTASTTSAEASGRGGLGRTIRILFGGPPTIVRGSAPPSLTASC